MCSRWCQHCQLFLDWETRYNMTKTSKRLGVDGTAFFLGVNKHALEPPTIVRCVMFLISVPDQFLDSRCPGPHIYLQWGVPVWLAEKHCSNKHCVRLVSRHWYNKDPDAIEQYFWKQFWSALRSDLKVWFVYGIYLLTEMFSFSQHEAVWRAVHFLGIKFPWMHWDLITRQHA